MTSFAIFYLNFIWSFFLLKFSFELLDSFTDMYLDYKVARKCRSRIKRGNHLGNIKFYK